MEDTTPWRILLDPPSPGAWNMAVDEAILEAVSAGASPPTLRLYRWEPACLSLGYGQRYREVDEAGLLAHGWDVVRRPTGGKAILHVDELTYSVAAADDHPLMQGGVLQSYRRIAAALLAGLENLAVPAVTRERYERVENSPGPVCFEVPSDWEITWEGRKLVGSAQVRRRGGVLQHGTIPLHGDLARIAGALAFETPEDRTAAAKRVPGKATTVEAVLGRRVAWEEAAEAVRGGFIQALGICTEDLELSPGERQSAIAWQSTKYGNRDWTRRRY
ncbi:MAG TPA: lipoate--protein ligase family protein [Anaerolineales bacterium]|nr:lipoate--protein ligase family protein [Anaerolineales bacterium]